MTQIVQNPSLRTLDKKIVTDISFQHNGILFVKPTPKLGSLSSLWPEQRPRRNSTGIKKLPVVAIVFVDLALRDWELLRSKLPNSPFFTSTYESWRRQRITEQSEVHHAEKPVVSVRMTCEQVLEWCRQEGKSLSRQAIGAAAACEFNKQALIIRNQAMPFLEAKVLPSSYILCETQEIGQDIANDISTITMVRESLFGTNFQRVAQHLRIFHEHAMSLAAAYSVREGTNSLFFKVDKTYGWE